MRLINLVLAVLFLLAVFQSGCISQDNETKAPSGKLSVATTIAPLSEFIRSVGGDEVEVTVVVPPGAEPHTYEPTPSQVRQISDADLYVMNGAGLEFWMETLIRANKNLVILDSSLGIDLISEGGEGYDLHVWVSLRNAKVQVENICQGLIQVDPANRNYYEKNRDLYLQKLSDLDREFEANFTLSPRKIFVVHHPAWSYFARDYGLVQVPIMENEKEPGPRYLGQVMELAKSKGIKTIFVEPEFNAKSAEVLAREMNASIVYLDPLAENYLENIKYAGEKIGESLRE
jgi:zinc transport system substrate-binding protein